jgi:hypothetical protein
MQVEVGLAEKQVATDKLYGHQEIQAEEAQEAENSSPVLGRLIP